MTQPNHIEVREAVERIVAGDVRALARAISLVENDAPEAQAVLSACFPHTGHALRIGITGAPGAGKSTLVDRLARAWRDAGRKVGVVAVDPTSPFTGGAILGDRIRMQERLNDDGLYIRSMATRGSLGGLAKTTADVAQVLEASGKDIVLIETVGVGQDEIDIVRLADITIVVLVPGMGDDVQSIKAGIMEIADIFVINKADREGADRVEKEIRALQSLSQTHVPREPPIVRTVGTTGIGIPQLLAVIDETRQWLAEGDRLEVRRKQYWRARMEEMVRQALLKEARAHGLSGKDFAHHAELVAAGQEDPYRVVPELVADAFPPRHAPPKPESNPTRIDHLGIAVASLDTARKLYESLGLHVAQQETIEHEQVTVAMIPTGGGRIELLQPTGEDSPVGKFLKKRGEGLHHVALHVEDIAATLTALKAQGARLVNEQIQMGAGGHLYFFVHPASAGGVLLEICQDVPQNVSAAEAG